MVKRSAQEASMSIDSRHILGYLEGIVDAIVWKSLEPPLAELSAERQHQYNDIDMMRSIGHGPQLL